MAGKQTKVTRSFEFKEPKKDQPERYAVLRKRALSFGEEIEKQCPNSREQALALTKLEEALMWSVKSIAVNE